MKNRHINRDKRSFIKQSLGLGLSIGATAAMMPAYAHDPEKKPPPKTARLGHGKIVGHGEFTYKVNAFWGDLDRGKVPVENCHGLDIDSKGRIILFTDSDVNNFVIYNKDGKLLDAWGTQYPGAHSIKVSRENGEDFLYVVDCGWVLDRKRPDNKWENKWYRQSGFISKLTLDGKLVFTIGHPVTYGIYTPDMRFQPTDITIAPNGDLYVTDGYGSDYVIHYDSNGKYIRHWGGHKNTDKTLNLSTTHGISVDTREADNHHLLVSSRAEQKLKKFSLDGKYLGELDLNGAYVGGPIFKGEHFYAPVCWSHVDGRAPNSGFITIVDKHNKVVSNPGGTEPKYVDGKLQKMASNYDVFNHCHSVCVDEDDSLYVGQWNANQAYPIKLERV